MGKRGESNRLGIGNVRQKNHKKSLNISKEQKDMDLSKHLTIEHEWLNYDHGGVQQIWGCNAEDSADFLPFFAKAAAKSVDRESLVMWIDCLKPESVML